MVSPIFILSLPRAGSTWLQRVLSASPDIATASEPWVLLPPLLPLMESKSSFSLVGFDHITDAIEDLTRKLPNQKKSYLDAIRVFASQIYSDLSEGQNTKYFLDKTPRYYFISEELLNIFPDAKIIYLWRNPLAVAASMFETWASSRTGISRSKVDLFLGMERLIASHRNIGKHCITINYENTICDPEGTLTTLSNFLGVEIPKSALDNRSAIRGKMGDPLASYNQNKSREQRLSGWVESFRPILRRKWATKYLNWIGAERMAYMGYDYDETLANMNAKEAVIFRGLLRDISASCGGAALTWLETDIMISKFRALRKKHLILPHN
ncbi:MAG: sulfotransferase [Alphaproteobacteria bacterium]|nr:MAG: sulfotransferase [Alphaproteobacteria bacterium]